MEILPAIDLKEGKCVRLEKGDFSSERQVADDPVDVAVRYKRHGAKIIHVVDLDGAKDGVRKNAGLVKKIAQAAYPAKIELGGGLRVINDLDEADRLGVWRFVIGSAAVENPSLVEQACARYPGRIAVGIDAQGGKVKTRGWAAETGLDAFTLAGDMEKLGVETVIFTDIDTDGMLGGPSMGQLARMRASFGGCLIASGGVSGLADIRALRKLGVQGAIVGKALYSGNVDLSEAIFEARYGRLFDKSELIPAVIQHDKTKKVLMLGYMNGMSLKLTLETGMATFFSRSRQSLWVKGESSGNYLRVREVLSDCDDDTLLLSCEPDGPTCHTGNESCFLNAVELLNGGNDEPGI